MDDLDVLHGLEDVFRDFEQAYPIDDDPLMFFFWFVLVIAWSVPGLRSLVERGLGGAVLEQMRHAHLLSGDGHERKRRQASHMLRPGLTRPPQNVPGCFRCWPLAAAGGVGAEDGPRLAAPCVLRWHVLAAIGFLLGLLSIDPFSEWLRRDDYSFCI